MEKKEDRRVAMTRRMLKDALIELLKQKDIYHVSIRELCELADVNRTTFYKYYGSQFDLLSDMEKDMLDFLSKTIAEHPLDVGKIIEISCEYLEDNLESARLIVNNNVDSMFPQKLMAMEILRNAALKKLISIQDEEAREYYYNYISYGLYSTVRIWLNKEQRESPKQFAALIMLFF